MTKEQNTCWELVINIFLYDFFQFIMNILVIVFKIEILIYNTQMNSTLRQFMSTGVHWISTGFPLEFHWTSTELPLEWKSSGLQWTLGGKHYNKIIRLQNSSGIPVNSSGKVLEFQWNSTGKALESVGHRKDLDILWLLDVTRRIRYNIS